MDYTEWLDGLQVGMTVATGTKLYGYSIRKVERLTNTQIVVGTSRYSRKTGLLCGKSYGGTVNKVRPVTDKIRRAVMQVKRAVMARTCSNRKSARAHSLVARR